MAEYLVLLAASGGIQIVDSVEQSLKQNTLLWAGAGLLLLVVVGWLFKPRRW